MLYNVKLTRLPKPVIGNGAEYPCLSFHVRSPGGEKNHAKPGDDRLFDRLCAAQFHELRNSHCLAAPKRFRFGKCAGTRSPREKRPTGEMLC